MILKNVDPFLKKDDFQKKLYFVKILKFFKIFKKIDDFKKMHRVKFYYFCQKSSWIKMAQFSRFSDQKK